jgi:hypothetical protein
MNLSRAIIACAGLFAVIGDVSAQSIDTPVTEQERNTIRSIIMQQRAVPFANTHFRFSPGNAAPPDAAIRPLPPEIVRMYPQLRDYMYFVGGDQIVIVDSNTGRIVSILPV